MKVLILCFGCLFGLFTGPSCTSDPQGLEGIDSVCFETQIQPLLKSSCGNCHSGSNPEEGYSFDTYDEILSSVEPGNARKSKLYQAITAVWMPNLMPPDQPLSVEDRTLIKVWIEQGAKNTICSSNFPGNPDVPGLIYNTDTICFNLDILPLLSSSCGKSGCHDAITAEEDIVISNYKNIGQNTKLVKAGNYSESKLYKVLVDNGDDRMPPSPENPLSQDQINKIKKWISEGALNSNCMLAICDTAGIISFANQVWPFIQNNCAGCHPASGTTNGVSLGNYSQVKNSATSIRNNMPVLLGVIQQKSGFKSMPPSGKPDNCNIAILEKWIYQGMANN